jgi:hypothetical protein
MPAHAACSLLQLLRSDRTLQHASVAGITAIQHANTVL